MTTPASAEPTEADRAVAVSLIERHYEIRPSAFENNEWGLADWIARALASQRAEIVARYEKVAEELDGKAKKVWERRMKSPDHEVQWWAGARAGADDAARCIREAAPK